MTMPRELRIRGLAGWTSSERLTTIFAQVGTVLSARVVMERRSGRWRGSGFVTMRNTAEAQRARRQLDGHELDGRILKVEVARGPDLPVDGPAARIVVSFLVGARAFRYLVDRRESLQPSAATAVEVARGRGCIAGCYYFLDIPDDIVRAVRNCLRRNGPGAGGGACVAAASAIENRRQGAWYSSSCPRCGGRFQPRGWANPGTLIIVCRNCELSMPA